MPGYFTYKAPPARVKISGDTGLTDFPADDLQPMFTYTLSEGENVLSTVQYRGAGRYAFPPINYTEAGTHTYTVKMENTGDDGVNYDTTEYTVTVEVTSGTDPFGFGKPVLTATVIEVDGQPASSASGLNFSTSYTAPAQPGGSGSGGSGEEQPGAQVVGNQISDDDEWFYETDTGWQWLGGNRWAYTFNVYEEDFTYYLWESPMSGYTTDTGEENPITILYHKASGETPGYITTDPANDRLIEYPAGSGEYYALITNEKGEDEAGLKVKKVVTGDGSKTLEYPITVTLHTDSACAPESVANTITGQFGEMGFVQGVSSFTLTHNASRTATGLPVPSTGLWYKVTEGDFEGKSEYTVTIAPAQGTVEVSATPVEIIVTNHKTEEIKGGLKIQKVVTGDTTEDDMNRTFQLTVTLYTDSARTQVATGINEQYGDLKFNSGVATKALKHNDVFTAQGIPLGSGLWYKVEETEVTGFTATYSGQLGQVSDTLPIATVTNSKDPTGGFSLKKVVSGGSANDEFTLTVNLKGLAKNTSYTYQFNQENRTLTANANGEAMVTLTMKNGDQADFSGLPINAQYMVTEAASEYVPSYAITNTGAGGSIERDSDAKSTPDQELATAWEKVEQNETILITYTNTYPVVTIQGHKSWEVPAGVTVSGTIRIWLMEDGVELLYADVGENENWQWTFENLPKFSGSHEIEYTVEEDETTLQPGFTPTVDGYNIINTYSEPINILVRKVWNDT